MLLDFESGTIFLFLLCIIGSYIFLALYAVCHCSGVVLAKCTYMVMKLHIYLCLTVDFEN